MDSLSNGNDSAIKSNNGLLAKPPNPVGEKKFSLVPFAKANSSSGYSSHSEATSLTQMPINNRDRMERIQETPEDVKDASGKDLRAALGATVTTAAAKN